MAVTREPEAPLLDALLATNPATVVAVGAAAAAAAEAFRAHHPAVTVRHVDEVAELDSAPDPRYDAAAVSGVVGVRSDRSARELLAALRDRHCRSMLLLVPAGAWRLTDYLALGFELRGEGEADRTGWELYWYDVDRSNPEREWNNPEHWANPENFKRHRW